ncbi:MAG: RIP metalloprotease RseP [Tissierellia bacterium]|nr:RIP metalloprotease RseP [Tissierellia bacterium]MDD4779556.1 RIP metalloprotease RseP [Tissierellia bacterium]
MITAISAILVFSLIVLVHEYGHYKVALNVGIKVEEFAIGMGPAILKKEKNGIIYSIRAIPLGGFCKMEGEEEEVKSSTSFSSKKVWQRFMVIAAGPIMNFLLALALFVIIALAFGVTGTTVDYIDETSNEYAKGLRTGDKIISVNDNKAYIWEDIFYQITNEGNKSNKIEFERDGKIHVIYVENNYRKVVGISTNIVNGQMTTTVSPTDMTSPAYKAGLNNGDRIIKINNMPVDTWEDIISKINEGENSDIKITVNRDGEILDFNVTPINQISVMYNTAIEKSFIAAIASSAYKTVYYIKLMFDVIVKIVTGQIGGDAVGGPVMVISMVGEAAKVGILPLMNLAAFISINLGFMNLLPIPALDGSKLVFLIIEGIRGKAIPIEKESIVHFIGFVLLLTLMIFITYKDILRVFRI